MPDSIMFSGDGFVVLEPDQPEQFLSPTELFDKLKAILADRQADLPRDLQRFDSIDDQAQYLMESSCELDVGPGQFLQWYVIRTEK
ncbi:chlororespiratory reduction protein 7 [Microcoleus sp. FACHB-1515]|uniref:chlororespiratory reduction protein 7 n=1 Tax=Cyanophyceae TaxID=3028117 RepID=UPI0016843562|nr:chlororespiratory reduction protein 7 [Microcoleus sp. FACHB-1515]MBD2091952.1 chlororespiratory reduction protein 7 [Microcoleus sp. FACHB-1515]